MTVIVNQSLYPVQAVERRFWHGNRYHAVSAKVTLAFDERGRLSGVQRAPASRSTRSGVIGRCAPAS